MTAQLFQRKLSPIATALMLASQVVGCAGSGASSSSEPPGVKSSVSDGMPGSTPGTAGSASLPTPAGQEPGGVAGPATPTVSNPGTDSPTPVSMKPRDPNEEPPAPIDPSKIDNDQDWSSYSGPDWGSPSFNGVGFPGTPKSAGSLPAGTSCEQFDHVKHLPWSNRPAECPTGDFCIKWDGDPNEQFPNGPEDVITGATTWFGNPVTVAAAGPLGGVAKIAIVSCKIGNQCLRFYGQNNCHYDLFDPDTNKTVKPPYMGGDEVPYSIKDGHDYLNFRVRLPGSNAIHNFTNVEATAAASPYYARYCPTDLARKGVVATFDPVEGNNALGCGPDSAYHPVAALVGETRKPIPYPAPGRSEYDWTYVQKHRHEQ